jgi:Zn-finger nucleic acid-binding protein
MALVAITVMGFRCERCAHEWIPRGGLEEQPKVCPKCRSAWWNRPPKTKPMTYEEFRDKVATALADGHQRTWTEVRTAAGLPQLFPNNKWVRRMETDIGLDRRRSVDGIIHWKIASKQ